MTQLKRDDDNTFFFSSEHDERGGLFGCAQHYHSLFEIYYMKSGSCNYFIDNKSYHVETGDLVLIPGGIIHKTQYNDNTYKRLLINCSKYFIPSKVYQELSDIGYIFKNNFICNKIDDIFSSIENDFNSPDEFTPTSLRCLIYSLFILIARNPNQKPQNTVKNACTERAIEYIRNNFSQDITLSSAAAVCAVSDEHLSRVFKKETGFGFSQYLTSVRLWNAEHLLKNSELSITEIAHRCGYNDSNYFSQIFKKNYKKTPREIRKQSV